MKKTNLFLETLRLAESVKGKTSPNPAVGCLIVKNNKIIGKGATQKAGCDHAEITALKNTREKTKGATLLVTLEPCVDYPGKKTSSCAKAIIQAGIREVYVGMMDPNPSIQGKGIAQLKEAGIKVAFFDQYLSEIRELNQDFFKYIQTGLPYVTVKYAMTLDGNIANLDGASEWISSEASRDVVQHYRNQSDAILVGIGTVLQDNPSLTVRIRGKNKDPLRIILDTKGQTPEQAQVMQGREPSLFIVKKGISDSFKQLCEQYQKKVLEMDTMEESFSIIPFQTLLPCLSSQFGIESLLIEGGGRVIHQAFREQSIDRFLVFIAPSLMGGKGIQPFEGKTFYNPPELFKLQSISTENIGEDILIKGYKRLW